MTQTLNHNYSRDFIGQLIKSTPEFRGKWRLIRYWMNHKDNYAVRSRTLPGGEAVFCHLGVPYESMV